MLPRLTVLLLGLVLAGAAPAGAATPEGCDTNPPNQGLSWSQVKPGYYVFVDHKDGQAADKIGFWKETNGVQGLQTVGCVHDEGYTIYDADTAERGVVLL